MFLKIRQHRTVRGQETRQECLRGREHCKLIFYHVKETCELCEDWQVWECVPPCGAMKPNLPWDWAWTPQRAFLLVHLILKASCLSGFGSAPGPEGQACVLQTHSDLRRLFEAGQTLFFFFFRSRDPLKTQSQQRGDVKGSRAGPNEPVGCVTAAVMRECLRQVNRGEISDSRSC